MESWQAILVAFGGNAVLLAVLAFLGRSIVTSALDKDLEKFKGQLQVAALEHEVRFRGLHQKRAEVIAELYKLLVKATWEAESFTSPIEWAGEPSKKEKYIAAQNAIAEYFRFFDQHRIYLSKGLCEKLESFAKELREPVIRFGIWVRHDYLADQAAQKKNDDWDSAWKKVRDDVPKLRSAIEDEFRNLIGVDVPQSNPSLERP
jgi:FMN phosphatase YigB (HAD superfamily)